MSDAIAISRVTPAATRLSGTPSTTPLTRPRKNMPSITTLLSGCDDDQRHNQGKDQEDPDRNQDGCAPVDAVRALDLTAKVPPGIVGEKTIGHFTIALVSSIHDSPLCYLADVELNEEGRVVQREHRQADD